MVSRYTKEFQVPPDFPAVLKAFSREVLRKGPGNIYEFGAEYFAGELEALGLQAAGGMLTAEQLEIQLRSAFDKADVDKSGKLSLQEFKMAIEKEETFGPLDMAEKLRLLKDVDVDGDGEIDYQEFLPLALDFHATRAMQAELRAQKDAAYDKAEAYLIKGMTSDELQDVMEDIFKKADHDGSGELSIAEFQECLRSSELGLKKKEIEMSLWAADTNQDGSVSFLEFAPICESLLIMIMKEEIMKKQAPEELTSELLGLFEAADADGTGKLPLAEIRAVLQSADLGLTRVQLHTVLAEALYDDDALVAYDSFAATGAGVIARLLDVSVQAQTAAMLAQSGAASMVHGYDAAGVSGLLLEACTAKDTLGSGLLTLADMREALSGSALGLSDKEVRALLSAIDADASGAVAYKAVVDGAFKILRHMSNMSVQASSY